MGPGDRRNTTPDIWPGSSTSTAGDYFEAHEVWEDLWHDTAGPDRRFFQGLIQAAVAVYHAGNGNARGARRLFHSGRRYMSAYPPCHLGLDVPAFWAALEAALAEMLPDHRAGRGPAAGRPAAEDRPDPRARDVARGIVPGREEPPGPETAMNEDLSALQDFTGVARLFPLPGPGLFPHAVQPLHIFEPRYRQMAADALAGDRLDRPGPAAARLGGDTTTTPRPSTRSPAWAGWPWTSSCPTAGTTWSCAGLARVRIVEELATDKRYPAGPRRGAAGQHCDDVDELMALRTAVADLILPRVTAGPVREQLPGLFKGELPLGHLCDVLAFALPLPPEAKQGLLEVLSVTCRARLLMEAFQAVLDDGYKPVGAGMGSGSRRTLASTRPVV